MGNIRMRGETNTLFFDFMHQGKRCREQTALDNTPANRKKLQGILDRIEAEITLGQFDYAKYFPNSSMVAKFESPAGEGKRFIDTPFLRDFAEQWFAEMAVLWRTSHASTVRITLENYLKPEFGNKEVGCITKSDILAFRTSLAKVKRRNGKGLSASRINHIMTPLRMILNEAANRFEFTSPYHGIKALKVPRSDVEPFGIEEVGLIIDKVRPDFRNYYITRFFTGMRTGEIDGLQWKFVDFARRQILVRQSRVQGEMVETKTDGSFRDIDMSEMVFQALQNQRSATGNFEFVFCNLQGQPLDYHNVNKRVWKPTLDRLGLRQRRAYQTRHTAATLWLASGESPEWIARQMGHTTTEMLFRVYSRYVPNLTRQDGSAFERLLKQHLPSSSGLPEQEKIQ